MTLSIAWITSGMAIAVAMLAVISSDNSIKFSKKVAAGIAVIITGAALGPILLLLAIFGLCVLWYIDESDATVQELKTLEKAGNQAVDRIKITKRKLDPAIHKGTKMFKPILRFSFFITLLGLLVANVWAASNKNNPVPTVNIFLVLCTIVCLIYIVAWHVTTGREKEKEED